MIKNTAIVIGPGGVGKGPLDFLFKPNIVRIDPYRLRKKGPKTDRDDRFYANPRLRNQLYLIFETLGDQCRSLGELEWFPKSKTLFFKVRNEWQVLILIDINGETAKAEIFAPILPQLVSDPEIRMQIGETVSIILLNPGSKSVMNIDNTNELKEITCINCKCRGDSEEDIRERVSSIDTELPVWQELATQGFLIDCYGWRFPEFRYKKPPEGVSLLDHQKDLLLDARRFITEKEPELKVFFITEEEISAILSPPIDP